MRIEKIFLKNYRQFKNIEIDLNNESKNDINIIIGKNGIGKTNLLNAINWCLYGDQPYFSKYSQKLPLMNLKSIDETEEGTELEIRAELWVKTEVNNYIKFIRKDLYRLNQTDGVKEPILDDKIFEVIISDDKNNSKILKDDEANSIVERFIPNRIREFFFFDGERLDDYFKEAKGENIRKAIFDISQLDILDLIEKNLSTIRDELDIKLSKANPKIERAQKIWKDAENNLKNIFDEYELCKKQVSIAKDNIKFYEDKLKGKPDVESLENERNDLKSQRAKKNENRNNKIKDKQKELYKYSKILLLSKALKNSKEIIQIKRKNKEIPINIDKKVLLEIIDKKECSICNSKLSNESINEIKIKIEQIDQSSEIGNKLTSMEMPLYKLYEQIKTFKNNLIHYNKDIAEYDEDLNRIDNRINEIDNELSNYNEEEILEWSSERKNYEKLLDDSLRELGILESRKEDQKTLKDRYENDYQTELKKEEKYHKLKKQREFCNKSLMIAKDTKSNIMTKTREQIQNETKNIFFDLIWKKQSFKDVFIDDNYNIKLIHKKGYECLDSVSAAERELMALSFTLALHKISGFDSPIIIDTPVARVSDENRENFGKIFYEVSKNKQIILLFTPDEYSQNISKTLDVICSVKSKFKSIDEEETVLEVLK